MTRCFCSRKMDTYRKHRRVKQMPILFNKVHIRVMQMPILFNKV